MEWPFFLGLGALAGLLAGLLGVGGGLVIVPALAWWFDHQGLGGGQLMQLALGTSLASIVFTSLSSVAAHHRRGAVRWGEVARLAPGILIGALLGAALADALPSEQLRRVFALFELMVAVQMGLSLRPRAARALPARLGMGAAGGGIGLVSSIVGIGGGTLTVPFLSWCGVVMREAVATSAACGLPIALAGALGYLLMGWGEAGLPPGTLGYIHPQALLGIAAASVLFAPLGARLAHALPGAQLKRLFALLLALIGLRMLWW